MQRSIRTVLGLAGLHVLLAGVAAEAATGFVEDLKLLATDGDSFDSFGAAVSASSGRIAIGANFDEDNGANSGAVYIFERGGAQWVETAKLLAGDGAEGDFFGTSLALSGDRLVVGANNKDTDVGVDVGAAYVFEFDGAQWVETRLAPSDGAAFDRFGKSVAISENRVVAGAVDHDANGPESGAAYVFEFDGAQWVETAKLVASNGEGNDRFGWSAALVGDRVVIGAVFGDNDDGASTGAAYVFEFDGAQWVETRLAPSDGEELDQFGATVSLHSDRVAVGSFFAGTGVGPGAAYIYEQHGDKWVETQVTASDGESGDGFASVALSDEVVAVGAPATSEQGEQSGSVYVFDIVVLGGEGTGTVAANATCLNQETGELVNGHPVGEGWNCLVSGFEVQRGDRIVQWAESTAVDSAVGGAVFGVNPGSARCLNLTTGQRVLIHLGPIVRYVS